jgi:hypothetical protein
MIRRAAALALLPLVLSACSYSVKLPTEGLVETSSKPAATATQSELPADALQVSITQTNNSYTKTKYWSVIAYPEFAVVSGPDAAQSIVTDIADRVAMVTDGFTQQAQNCYDPKVQNSSLNITARPDYVSQHLYVVQLEIEQYFCGAAHGDDFFETHAFDVATGQRVELGDQILGQSSGAFETQLREQLAADYPSSKLAQTLLGDEGWSLLEGAAWWPGADGLHVLVQGTPASYMDGTSCDLVIAWPDLKGKIDGRSVVGQVFAKAIGA